MTFKRRGRSYNFKVLIALFLLPFACLLYLNPFLMQEKNLTGNQKRCVVSLWQGKGSPYMNVVNTRKFHTFLYTTHDNLASTQYITIVKIPENFCIETVENLGLGEYKSNHYNVEDLCKYRIARETGCLFVDLDVLHLGPDNCLPKQYFVLVDWSPWFNYGIYIPSGMFWASENFWKHFYNTMLNTTYIEDYKKTATNFQYKKIDLIFGPYLWKKALSTYEDSDLDLVPFQKQLCITRSMRFMLSARDNLLRASRMYVRKYCCLLHIGGDLASLVNERLVNESALMIAERFGELSN